MPAILCALFVLAGGARVQPRVEVALLFVGPPMPKRVMSVAIAEATSVWEQYGVDIRIAPDEQAAQSSAVTLRVAFSNVGLPGVSDQSLGSIPFHGDSPGTRITLYPEAVARLVTETAGERAADEWPIAYREQILGRALGRALAHEIGHFLLRSPGHSPNGLMRARQSMTDMIDFARGRMFLSESEQTRLDRTIANLLALSAR